MVLSGEGFYTSAESEVAIAPLLDAKFRAAYHITSKVLGGASPAALAAVLYGTIYAPEWAAETLGDYLGNNADMHAAVTARIHRGPAVVPDPDEFDIQIRNALTRYIDHKACLYPKSQEVILAMAAKGPTAFWTQGDMQGRGVAPGSYEQIKKIAGAGAAELRRNAVLARAAMVLNCDERITPWLSLKRNEVLTAVAAEDKFSDTSITRLTSFFEPQGVTRLVILEDRLDNLERLQDVLRGHGFDTCGIWVQQGKYNAGNVPTIGLSKQSASMSAVPHIADVVDFVDCEPHGTGFVADYDGVFSNGEKRLQLQYAAVQAVFTKNNWL